ncbi:MAG: hypothetical protein Q8L86_10360 [Vicinamibacterales bacterium]|nr:hypothetical protein [Vicinamibacterales bacterium]
MELSAPTTLWRLYHPRGDHARAVVIPGDPQSTVTFFVNNVMDRAENFDELDVALMRADDIRRDLVDHGWREED